MVVDKMSQPTDISIIAVSGDGIAVTINFHIDGLSQWPPSLDPQYTQAAQSRSSLFRFAS